MLTPCLFTLRFLCLINILYSKAVVGGPAGPGVFFFGLSSDLEFFLNKIFFPIIKINRLPSITMEAQAVARDQHLARWKRVSIRFEFLALIMVVMLLVGSRVYFR